MYDNNHKTNRYFNQHISKENIVVKGLVVKSELNQGIDISWLKWDRRERLMGIHETRLAKLAGYFGDLE